MCHPSHSNTSSNFAVHHRLQNNFLLELGQGCLLIFMFMTTPKFLPNNLQCASQFLSKRQRSLQKVVLQHIQDLALLFFFKYFHTFCCIKFSSFIMIQAVHSITLIATSEVNLSFGICGKGSKSGYLVFKLSTP